MSRPRQQGFSLVELMIGVVIVGILAAVAIPTYTSYTYRSRMSEAVTFLGQIKQAQEAYRAKHGFYLAVTGTNWSAFTPTSSPGANAVAWTPTAAWEQLGAAPEGPVRFRYATIAGTPSLTAPSDAEVQKMNLDWRDFWYAARARGDLDGDGTTFFLEVHSQGYGLFNSVSTQGGYE